jgi:uncharacterized protein YjiS (DUF1127 family)
MAPVAAQHGTLSIEQLDGPLAPEQAKERASIMLVAILNFLQSWRRYNASLRELSQLGDRELADIGLTRSDIPRVAWEDANR